MIGSLKSTVTQHELNYNAQDFRGSASPLPYGDNGGYLGIVHDVCRPPIRERPGLRHIHYYSRFVWYDRNFKILKVSLPFYWFNKGVEYVLTMVWNKTKTALLVGVSVREKDAYLVEVDPKVVDKLPSFTCSVNH